MTRRFLTLVALAVFLLVVSAPFAAADDGPLIVATAETEDEGEGVSDEPMTDVVPAVEAEESAEEEEAQPWTSRFLVPTTLAVGVLGVVAAIGYYIVGVRGKYRVVS